MRQSFYSFDICNRLQIAVIVGVTFSIVIKDYISTVVSLNINNACVGADDLPICIQNIDGSFKPIVDITLLVDNCSATLSRFSIISMQASKRTYNERPGDQNYSQTCKNPLFTASHIFVHKEKRHSSKYNYACGDDTENSPAFNSHNFSS